MSIVIVCYQAAFVRLFFHLSTYLSICICICLFFWEHNILTVDRKRKEMTSHNRRETN